MPGSVLFYSDDILSLPDSLLNVLLQNADYLRVRRGRLIKSPQSFFILI